MNEKRLDWLDVAKGYGILFVIYAHTDYGFIGNLLYTFHVPLFFFLSGFVFSNKYDFKTFFIKKIKAIVIPYFLYGIPMFISQVVYMKTPVLELLKDFVIQRRLWTLWFIACLFWLNILFYWVVTLGKTYLKMGLLVAVIFAAGICYFEFGGPNLPWNMDICLTMVPFFFVGYVCKNYYDKLRGIINSVSKSVITFIICVVINQGLGILSIKLTGATMDVFHNQYGIWPLTYISAFAGIGAIVIFSHWFISRPIKYIGRYSMIYFAWHQHIFLTIVMEAFKSLGFVLKESAPYISKVGYYLLVDLIIVILITFCSFLIQGVKKKWFKQ